MHGHLIAVKVGIEASANKRVQPDCIPLNQRWLERLNAHSVQRWRTIHQNRMIRNHVLQNIPNFIIAPLKHPLSAFNCIRMPQILKLSDNKRLI